MVREERSKVIWSVAPVSSIQREGFLPFGLEEGECKAKGDVVTELAFDCEPFLELLGFLMIVSIVNLSFGDWIAGWNFDCKWMLNS